MGRKPARGRAATKRGTKAVGNSKNEPPTKKLKKEESFNTKLMKAIQETKESSSAKPKTYRIDSLLSDETGGKATVHEDYACMLNQTNIGQNNNKFYVIQVAKHVKNYIVFTKWGRVGEFGTSKSEYLSKEDEAINAFKKKFKDKTKNNWDDRDNFTPSPGKYTMLEMDEESDNEELIMTVGKKTPTTTSYGAKCKLDARTELLIKLIFNENMFTSQMAQMSLDVRKMPLGKLSKGQIAKGLEALIEIEEALKENKGQTVLANLTSKFYTLIPHNFGRMVPPVLDSEVVINQKKEVMMTLSDIELTQSLQKQKGPDNLHPLDEKYQKLGCALALLDKKSKEFQIVSKYASACKSSRNNKLLDVWRVDRDGTDKRFGLHKNITFRKLLWHGTGVAVVAAILKAGLRIMPHSGGCVGKGIYFASEHSKSAGYVGWNYGEFEKEKNVGFMFLTEVALGNMHVITQGGSHFRAAPKGYDSVVARGNTEPDSKRDEKLTFDGREVIVPMGSPVKMKDYKASHYGQSEYLVYKESQARIRYLLKFSF